MTSGKSLFLYPTESTNLQLIPGFFVLLAPFSVFELYRDELARKMIILSPKSHESDYLNYFSEAFAVYHDARITRSALIGSRKKVEIQEHSH